MGKFFHFIGRGSRVGREGKLKILEEGIMGLSLRRWERVGLGREMKILALNRKDTFFLDCM